MPLYIRLELLITCAYIISAQRCYISVIPYILVVCLIYTHSALGPVALMLWVYISGKPLMPMVRIWYNYHLILVLCKLPHWGCLKINTASSFALCCNCLYICYLALCQISLQHFWSCFWLSKNLLYNYFVFYVIS